MFRRVLVVVSGIGCLAAGPLPAQNGNSDQFSLAGTVVNSRTGEPIKRAFVEVTRLPEVSARRGAGDSVATTAEPVSYSAFTDSAGSFRFTGLPKGTYNPNARRPEFMADPGRVPQRIELTENKDGVTLRLMPLGAVQGKVVDQDGVPVGRVNIVALRVRVIDGFRDLVIDRSVSTDDRGVYRLWNFGPGAYYLKAAGRRGGTALVVADPMSYGLAKSFAPVYFGGGSSAKTATPVKIDAGSDVHADFTVNMVAGYRVRGTLTDFIPRRPVVLELLRGEETISTGAVRVNAYDGQFEMLDVVPGSYTLRATQGNSARGETLLNVGAGDVNGINVVLGAPVDIPYTMRVTGAPKEYSDPLSGEKVAIDPAELGDPCSIGLHPFQTAISPRRRLERDGPRAIPGVLPGAWQAVFQCPAGYMTSAVQGGQDLLADPNIVIQPGAAPAPIAIEAHYGGGSVSGKLHVAGRDLAHPPAVLLVPKFTSGEGPKLTTAFGEGDQGQFNFPALAPGDYVAYGFSTNEAVEFRNPEFLQSLSGGVPLHVDEDAETKIEIEKVAR